MSPQEPPNTGEVLPSAPVARHFTICMMTWCARLECAASGFPCKASRCVPCCARAFLYQVGLEHLTGGRVCVVCGCSDSHPCLLGCGWDPELAALGINQCTRCVPT